MTTLSGTLKKRRDEEAQWAEAQFGATQALDSIMAETAAPVTVDTNETAVLSVDVVVGGARYIAVRFWAECNVAGALTITCRLYVGADLKASTRQVVTAAGYRHFDWNCYIEAGLGSHAIAVRMLTSASSLAIAAGQAQILLSVRGVAGA